MAVTQVRKIRSKLALKTAIILLISAAGTGAVGCSDSDSAPLGSGGKSSAGAGGKASAGASGKAGSGGKSSGGAAGEGAAPDLGTAGDDDGDGDGEAAGAGDQGGEGGSAGEPGEAPFSAHLSPTATPQILNITSGGHDRFYGVTFDSDNNIYAVGVTAPGIDTATDFATVVAKFSPEGELDTSFGVSGYAIRNVVVGAAGELARGIVIQPSGKIVISTSIEHVETGANVKDRDIALLRYLPNGKKDTTFGVDGVVTLDLSPGVLLADGTTFLADSVWGLDMYPDGRLVLSAGQVSAAGTDTDFAIVRLSKDGVLDEAFGSHGVFNLDTLVGDPPVSDNASPRNVMILPGTQGILGAGYQPVPGADTKPCVYHVTDEGKLDTAWGVDGVFSEPVYTEQTETYAAVPQSTGKFVTTGYARELSTETTDILSMRLEANGTRDLSYGTDGAVKIDIGGFGDNSRKLLVLPNDHIILVGGGRPVTDNVDGVVVALDQDGKPETTFSASGWKTYDLGGPADFLWGVALSPSRTRIAVVGIKGVGAGVTTDDDAVLMVMKLVP